MKKALLFAAGVALFSFVLQAQDQATKGQSIYKEQCAACHGESGRGDGPKARTLKGPPPANLTDHAVMGDMALIEIFRRISVGTPGTAMPEFGEDLSAAQVLAFLAERGLAATDASDPARARAGATAQWIRRSEKATLPVEFPGPEVPGSTP